MRAALSESTVERFKTATRRAGLSLKNVRAALSERIMERIQNCVALGQSVSAQEGAHRVVGENSGGTLSGNYAWSGVQVNGQPVTDGLADNENGEDILVHDSLIYGKNAQIFAWPGFDTAVWELRNDQPASCRESGIRTQTRRLPVRADQHSDL